MPNISFTFDWRGEKYDEMWVLFHGALKVILIPIFDVLKNTMCKDYTIQEYRIPRILNGKCYRSLEVQIIGRSDVNTLNEWRDAVIALLESKFRCKVTFFKDINKFLNA